MFKSIFHWKVFVNLILILGLLAGGLWMTSKWLERYTSHGQEIPVPNVVNLSVKEAIKKLDENGLSYEVDSFKFNPKYKPLQVLEIFPKTGAKVKEGREIVLKVNPSTWAKVQVPDVLDVYKGLAFRQLDQVGLKVGDTIYEHNIQRDGVVRMLFNGHSLKPGTLLPRFSEIDIVIGSGPMKNITVPNLVGMTVSEAKRVVRERLFEVGLIDYDGENKQDGEDNEEDESALVYYQDPQAGSLRDQGMQMDLWASTRPIEDLEDKIKELNATYRKIQVDTMAHYIIYENVTVSPVQSSPKKEEGTSKPKVKPQPQKPQKPQPKQEEKPVEEIVE